MTIEKIENCARCRGVHHNVEMTALTGTNPHYTHFALCPTNAQPILIQANSDSDKAEDLMIIAHDNPLELPIEEQKIKTYPFPYVGWSSIEQLEDVIGENESCSLHFGNFDTGGEDDELIKYDLEITIRRTKRSTHKTK